MVADHTSRHRDGQTAGLEAMLTYQLQRRNFKIADGAAWIFPNDVEIEFWFEPQEPFGTRHGYSRTTLLAVPASIVFNANNGFCSVRPEKPLDPVEVGVHYDNIKYDLQGNKLLIQCRCETQDDLAQIIYHLQGFFPPILNVFLYHSPIITVVQGNVGGTAFRWELADIRFALRTTTPEQQEADLGEMTRLRDFEDYLARLGKVLAATGDNGLV